MNVVPSPSSPLSDPTSLVQRLFVQHSAQIRGFLTALAPNPSLADDAFQETFITITRKAETFDANRDFLAWACGIGRLKLLEGSRRPGACYRLLAPEVLETLCACEPMADADDERLGHLKECIKSLAPRARRIVEMCYQESHKPAEIARRLDWTPEAVYVALSRARSALRQCVDRKSGVTPT